MQRSRSSRTRSEIAIGFSKCRFSSTKRLSPGPVGERLVLERALAALVADRAVERVVGQQELEHAVLGLLHLVDAGDDLHALGDLDEARRLQRGAARALDLDQAHAAHADRLHARVVAKARDVGPGPLGRLDDQLALASAVTGAAVEREGELLVRRASCGSSALGVSQRGTPLP